MKTLAKLREAARKAVETRYKNSITPANRRKVRRLATEIKELEFKIDDDFTRDAIIFREINKTTWKSFCRFGDRNHATKALILNWIENKAAALDVQAMYISEQYNIEIEPDELAQFIQSHDRGKNSYPEMQKLTELKQLYKSETNLNYNHKLAAKFVFPQPKRSKATDMPF